MANAGQGDLPLPGTKGAPKKFKGKHSDVEPFLYFYTKLCQKHEIITDTDKIEGLIHYCSRTVRETLEGLQSFKDKNWNQFKEDIAKYYEAERDKKRFRISDLNKFVEKSEKQRIRDLADWMKYRRGFVRIAGWLSQKSKITLKEYKTYLWIGIHHRLRDLLEARIMAAKPDHNLEEPFEEATICKAAENLLREIASIRNE